MENNRLQGTIPAEYGRMAKLVRCAVLRCAALRSARTAAHSPAACLSNCLQAPGLTTLTATPLHLAPTQNWLRFADNSFSGPLPDTMAATAPHLYQLQLDGNNFEVRTGWCGPRLRLHGTVCSRGWCAPVQWFGAVPAAHAAPARGGHATCSSSSRLLRKQTAPRLQGDLHVLADHSMINFNAADNLKLVRFGLMGWGKHPALCWPVLLMHARRWAASPLRLPLHKRAVPPPHRRASLQTLWPQPCQPASPATQCGMVPVGLRFAHGFNPYNTGLGLPCPEEVTRGWVDLTETLA